MAWSNNGNKNDSEIAHLFLFGICLSSWDIKKSVLNTSKGQMFTAKCSSNLQSILNRLLWPFSNIYIYIYIFIYSVYVSVWKINVFTYYIYSIKAADLWIVENKQR